MEDSLRVRPRHDANCLTFITSFNPHFLKFKRLYILLGKHSYYFHFLTDEETGTQIG